ncbi:MAG: chromate efflux transporter [Acidobacteriia bacterium]|nr:chromate efflux transporter [Terriglobia bacterium]
MNKFSKLDSTAPADAAPLVQFLLYFLKLGTIGFGGPIALAELMQRDLVEKRQWISSDDYLDGLALAQLSPGPLAAQLAIYLGFVRAGFLGATLVGIVFIVPSFLMVLGLAIAYVRFGGLRWMQAVFYGIGGTVIAIIARAAVKLVRTVLKKDKLLWTIFFLLALSTAITEREIAWLFVAGGMVVLAIRSLPARWVQRSTTGLVLTLGGLHLSARSWEIFLFFAKAGLFVFGSGLAIVPFLHGGVVLEHHWLTERQFVDAVAVAMITPGPVVITVGFIGYLIGGFTGSLAAAMGVFLPVFLVVVVLGPYYKRFAKNPQLHAFVQGVTAAAVGAIAGAVVVIARRTVHDWEGVAIAIISLFILVKWKIPEPLLIAAAALAGLFLYRGT